MHILPLLMLALLFSCTASKKERQPPEERTTPPPPPEYVPTKQGGSPSTKSTSSRGDGKAKVRDTGAGKETVQHEDQGKVEGGKETVQHEDPGKAEEGEEPEQPEDPGKVEEGEEPEQPEGVEEAEEEVAEPEPEVLTVKLSFIASDEALYPLLEFSEQYLVEIRDVELSHAGEVTLKLEDKAYAWENKGIKLPPMAFWLKLKWGDKTCLERVEVEDMTQVTEVLCR